MNVVHIISSFRLGGTEVLMVDVMNNTTDSDFNLFVISNADGPLSDSIKSNKAQLKFFPKKGIDVRYILKLRKMFREKAVDIVHVHDIINGFNVLLAGLFLDVKLVYTVHGWKKSRKKNILLTLADHVLFVSDSVRKQFHPDEKSNHKIHNNGIDPLKFTLPGQEKKIDGQPLKMGFIGNFNSVRDQLTVCKALKQVRENIVHFQFLFIGEKQPDGCYDECNNYCEKHNLMDVVEFCGKRDDVPEILTELDLFVYSSNHDTFGIAVVEAMMSGTPVLVNDLDVFKEITNDGTYAKLYKSKDEKDLSEKMMELMQNDAERKALGEKGKKWAVEQFSIQKHIQKLSDIYQDILQ